MTPRRRPGMVETWRGVWIVLLWALTLVVLVWWVGAMLERRSAQPPADSEVSLPAMQADPAP